MFPFLIFAGQQDRVIDAKKLERHQVFVKIRGRYYLRDENVIVPVMADDPVFVPGFLKDPHLEFLKKL